MEKMITFSQWLHENKYEEGLSDFVTDVIEPNWFPTGVPGTPSYKPGGIIPTAKAAHQYFVGDPAKKQPSHKNVRYIDPKVDPKNVRYIEPNRKFVFDPSNRHWKQLQQQRQQQQQQQQQPSHKNVRYI